MKIILGIQNTQEYSPSHQPDTGHSINLHLNHSASDMGLLRTSTNSHTQKPPMSSVSFNNRDYLDTYARSSVHSRGASRSVSPVATGRVVGSVTKLFPAMESPLTLPSALKQIGGGGNAQQLIYHSHFSGLQVCHSLRAHSVNYLQSYVAIHFTIFLSSLSDHRV